MIPSPGRPPAYVVARYRGSTDDEVLRNIRRASLLAKILAYRGYAPICVHAGIQHIYGREETPELREIGLQVDVSLVRLVRSHPQGALFVLKMHNADVSDGMTVELDAWGRGASEEDYARVHFIKWSDLKNDAQKIGDHEVWRLLSEPGGDE